MIHWNDTLVRFAQPTCAEQQYFNHTLQVRTRRADPGFVKTIGCFPSTSTHPLLADPSTQPHTHMTHGPLSCASHRPNFLQLEPQLFIGPTQLIAQATGSQPLATGLNEIGGTGQHNKWRSGIGMVLECCECCRVEATKTTNCQDCPGGPDSQEC